MNSDDLFDLGYSCLGEGAPGSEGAGTERDLSIELDDEGRPVGVHLRSGWRECISPHLLGLMLTAELARMQAEAAQTSATVPFDLDGITVTQSRELQEEMAALQHILAQQLQSLADADDHSSFGDTVASSNRKVEATLFAGRITRLHVDGDWANRAASHRIVEMINDCLEKANETLQCLSRSNELDSCLRDISRLLRVSEKDRIEREG